ncbi:lysozyme inhibitor LprI family protein [Janthinobacterium sp. HLX7-2]|uniref:lysozyme inhibitor LprI family protein n=1 Tax=Janthinobacterium sp. HLX7-2 TaxID=1259331 RepID=UPI003F29385A
MSMQKAVAEKLAARLDANGKQTLKAGQLAWIGKRNKSCSKRESSGFYVNLDCASQTTIERAQLLQERVREYVNAGCQNSKLSAVHALAQAGGAS